MSDMVGIQLEIKVTVPRSFLTTINAVFYGVHPCLVCLVHTCENAYKHVHEHVMR